MRATTTRWRMGLSSTRCALVDSMLYFVASIAVITHWLSKQSFPRLYTPCLACARGMQLEP